MAAKPTDDNFLPDWIEAERQERERLRAQYPALFNELSAILFELDPIGIAFEDNTDEYDAEVGTILRRLEPCSSVEDVRQVVHQEFVRWFEADIAGEEAAYQQAAERIWGAWTSHKRR